MDPYHTTSSGLASDTYETLLIFHCSEDDVVLKIFFLFLVASVLGPEGRILEFHAIVRKDNVDW